MTERRAGTSMTIYEGKPEIAPVKSEAKQETVESVSDKPVSRKKKDTNEKQ